MNPSAAELPKKFKDAAVLVIGDFMLDEYIQGSVDRISPEAPVPVVLQTSRRHVPGGAGNVVCNLRALGARVLVAGTIGDDYEGDELQRTIEQLGVVAADIALLRIPGRPTTRKTRIMAANQQVCRLDREDRTQPPADIFTRLSNFIELAIEQVQGIIISDYDKGVITPELIELTVSKARQRGIFVSIDPQVTHFSYYQQVDVLTPNHHEAGRFLGQKLETDQQVEAGGREIVSRLNARMLLITRGDRGMSLIRAGQARIDHFPTVAREVFDVTGAGDTVISVFTLAMTAGATAEQATVMSNQAAGIVVGRIGAATVTIDELVAIAAKSSSEPIDATGGRQ